MYSKFFYLFYLLIILVNVQADQKYFLCGPDEDGCSPDYYEYCLCMPHDGPLANEPYCLNFEDISCVPLSQTTHCESSNIFKNQASCLATAFQSEPDPPCKITTYSFCIKHHIPLCQQDEGLNKCH